MKRRFRLATFTVLAALGGCIWAEPLDEAAPATGSVRVQVRRYHWPVPGLDVRSTYGSTVIAQAVTDADGVAVLDAAAGGEITAAYMTSAQQLALSLSGVELERDYTLIWPHLTPAYSEAPFREISVAITNPPQFGTIANAGFCPGRLLTGTSGLLPVADYCVSPAGSFYVTATASLEPDLRGVDFLTVADTHADLSLAPMPRSTVAVEVALPFAAGMHDVHVRPLRLSMPIAQVALAHESGEPTAHPSLENLVHVQDADELTVWASSWVPELSIYLLRRTPVMSAVVIDDLDSEACIFEFLDLRKDGERLEVSLASGCRGEGLSVSLMDGDAIWTGIYPPTTRRIEVPLLPFELTVNAHIGASSRHRTPAVPYDHPALWTVPFQLDTESYTATRQGTSTLF